MSSAVVDRFAGRVVLVTGGGSGIGRAAARRFAAEGADVVVVGRRAEPLAETVDGHDHMSAVVGDVSRRGAAAGIVDEVVGRHGRLDVLVNNAAVWTPKPVDELTDDDIVDSLMTNQFGVLTLIGAAVANLAAAGGNIVNLSSTGARAPLAANSLYAGTKAAVEQMTRTLALELGPRGIRVNAVASGATATEMIMSRMDSAAVDQTIAATPLGRLGAPDDVASSILFLASTDAAWVTGQILQSSGGLML